MKFSRLGHAQEIVYSNVLKVARKLMGAKVHTVGSYKYLHIPCKKKNAKNLFIIHGFADTSESYALITMHLKSYNIYIPYLPAMDGIMDRSLTYDLKYYVQVMSTILDHLKLESFTLFGHSFGGGISGELYETKKYPIDHLILMDPLFVAKMDTECITKSYLAGDNVFLVESKQDLNRLMNNVFFRNRLPPILAQRFFEHLSHYRENFSKIFDDTFNSKGLKDQELNWVVDPALIDIPTSIIWGKQDKLFPVEYAYILQEHINDSQVYIIDEAGHCPHMETPFQLARIIKKIL
jgi:pimeloyl-ACP methyl ester carboxylesterase